MVVLVTCKNKEEPIKNEELEWSEDFPHYNPMKSICCHGNQSSDLIGEAFGSGELKRVWFEKI